IYVDATFGGGGHSKAILQKLGKTGKLIAIDQDKNAEKNIINDKRFTFVRGNFRWVENYLEYLQIDEIDGVLADLGVSWHHFNEKDRGFSFLSNVELDMRMNTESELTAGIILETYEQNQLAKIFKENGELKFAYKLSQDIVNQRNQVDVKQTQNFVEMVSKYTKPNNKNKILAQVFQALRIEVNQEIEALEEFLNACKNIIKPGGRLAVISYHSIEDRMVKNIIRSGNIQGKIEQDIYGNIAGEWIAVNRKIIIPSEKEIEINSKSRSAKLRIAERKIDE
ncbi:MAG: 16S rRNA (cytosine(1402)-N(4))-methyltransferase RsmH, partial [Bacteroidales bacterium]|nr:16S rRNA (cytosine(1402)-N(4))-methyltransferase RsmH [Bacteroidales bacterium]